MAETNILETKLHDVPAPNSQNPIPVASALIVFEGSTPDTPLVKDLRMIPPGAHVLVAASHNRTAFTLPGGKVEPSDIDRRRACARETWEETDLTLDPDGLSEFHREVVPAESDPSSDVDITTFHAAGAVTGIVRAVNETREVAMVPVFGKSPVPLSALLGGMILPMLRTA
ncbi:NUDIX domain-containing protein [Candidatus Saccharibacteria bacterium]|nr:NUDIX domain-containing protein [Candidatus Saccharibacteria bacterium]